MMLRTNLDMKDDIRVVADYCETGSTLEIQNSVGSTLICLACIPPAILVRIRDALSEEIALGARKSSLEKRLAPGERKHEPKVEEKK